MIVKAKPIVCERSPNLTHTSGREKKTAAGVSNMTHSAVVTTPLSAKCRLSSRYFCRYRSAILRRMLGGVKLCNLAV